MAFYSVKFPSKVAKCVAMLASRVRISPPPPVFAGSFGDSEDYRAVANAEAGKIIKFPPAASYDSARRLMFLALRAWLLSEASTSEPPYLPHPVAALSPSAGQCPAWIQWHGERERLPRIGDNE